MNKIEESQLEARLKEVPTWTHHRERNAIQKEMRFANFVDCFAFMTRVAFLAESMNHHPEFFQCYNQLRILLTTHDAGGLSELDLQMAKTIDRFRE
ncbi:MAG: 4a-hydroxytetrahydrobiopterin dehydratase [Myxococcota bacterium]|nr:4a-hydroxytetrahydrobiopterin dehydratase [Myxococcota bacterium]